MEKTRYTKGPWRLPTRNRLQAIEPTTIEIRHENRIVAYVKGNNVDCCWANALLIAMSPDIVEAIEDCIPDLKHYVSTHGAGPDKRLEKLEFLLGKLREED